MKTVIIRLSIGLVLMFAGCAAAENALNKIAPNQINAETNQEIPGTHTPTPLTADTAGAIPYGSIALSILLLGVNFFQKYQADKVGKGLKSTIQAIEVAGNDPAMADAISKLKVQLSNAHQVAGIQPVIQDILAKI